MGEASGLLPHAQLAEVRMALARVVGGQVAGPEHGQLHEVAWHVGALILGEGRGEVEGLALSLERC